MKVLIAMSIFLASCSSGDDIDEIFERTCDDPIDYLARVRLWVDREIVDQFRPGLRVRGGPDGEGLEPTQTEEPAAVGAGYLIEFRFAGDREYQDLEFFVDTQFAATVIAGGQTSAASYCNDEEDPGADQIPSFQIVHHDVALDQI